MSDTDQPEATEEERLQETIKQAIHAAYMGDLTALQDHLSDVSMLGGSIDEALDLETGGTVLHIAALRGHLECIKATRRSFFSRCPNPLMDIDVYNFVTQQDFQGNTALHCAVQQGNTDIVRSVYRYASRNFFPGEEPTNCASRPIEEAQAHDFSSEESLAKMLAFIRARNLAGRDAGAEARLAGQEANAKWCDEVVTRLDPDNKYDTDEAIQLLTQQVKERHDNRLAWRPPPGWKPPTSGTFYR